MIEQLRSLFFKLGVVHLEFLSVIFMALRQLTIDIRSHDQLRNHRDTYCDPKLPGRSQAVTAFG